ncbi:MAG TPA: Maf family protein [Candidatus Binatia bacterium]|nr:Maf family protein [Candidatus Binatia bacterium]
MTMPLVLASASPRRRELLAALGFEFTLAPTAVDEEAVAAGREPREGVLAVALAKVRAAAAAHPAAVVLAADTIVVADGVVFGKPAGVGEARRMLFALRGRSHEVLTAVAARVDVDEVHAVVSTEVHMRPYAHFDVDAYVRSGAPLDKAGAYGIQDEPFAPVAGLSGCYCSVVGLPLWTALRLLARCGRLAPRRPDQAFACCAVCPLRPDD